MPAQPSGNHSELPLPVSLKLSHYPLSPTIEKGRGFAYACPRPKGIAINKSGGITMDESQGQGPAWIVFLVWLLVPLLVFFLVLTFTG
ncbi:MAG TPA: hypothetical protein VGX03_23625 [Candidatus Binatia bacterium]|jgi:hypothetical protein|nr:hypothetical protein [Candidatus Binatia bacterium]